MRICSFLPSATEIVCALGLADSLVGVTDGCDYPAEVRSKPRIVFSLIDAGLSSAEIEFRIRESALMREPVFKADIERLRLLKPDLILTQGICSVCAMDGDAVFEIADAVNSSPEVAVLDPHDIEGVFDTIKQVGDLTGTSSRADKLVQILRERIDSVREVSQRKGKLPRVFCMEWLDPPYTAGHWIPEMVETAGGKNGLGKTGEKSRRVSWDEITDFAPEKVVLMPCGFGIQKTVEESARLSAIPQWSSLPAVEKGEVYAVDSNSHFTRPSPRIAEGIDVLTAIIHPEFFGKNRSAHQALKLTSRS